MLDNTLRQGRQGQSKQVGKQCKSTEVGEEGSREVNEKGKDRGSI